MRSRSHPRRPTRRRGHSVLDATDADGYQVPADHAPRVPVGVAHVDRVTSESHLEPPLAPAQCTAVQLVQLTTFAEHVSQAGAIPTGCPEHVSTRAGVSAGRTGAARRAGTGDRFRP